MFSQHLAVFLLVLLGGCNGLLWSSAAKDHARLELCSGEALKLNWPFDLSPGERVKDMEWRHVSEKGKERVVAVYERMTFTPMAEFSGRVAHEGSAAIELSCATILDSGNYTLLVTTLNAASTPSHHSRSTTVFINDTPKTLSGKLEVQQETKAVHDVITNLWHVQLTCGQFTDQGHPVFDVIWKGPNGQQHNSSKFENGYFHLNLPNPPKGGNYTCSLPYHSPATMCLLENSELHNGVTIEVDEVAARFTLLEAHQGQLDQETEELRNKTRVLQESLDIATQRVSFHATLGTTFSDGMPFSDIQAEFGERLEPFEQVANNEGQAFDETSGMFTAPLDGTYFFVASTAPRNNQHGNMALTKEGVELSATNTYHYNAHVMGSCHATVHLRKGDRVWLESTRSDNNFWSGTSFTGFLLNADN